MLDRVRRADSQAHDIEIHRCNERHRDKHRGQCDTHACHGREERDQAESSISCADGAQERRPLFTCQRHAKGSVQALRRNHFAKADDQETDREDARENTRCQ